MNNIPQTQNDNAVGICQQTLMLKLSREPHKEANLQNTPSFF